MGARGSQDLQSPRPWLWLLSRLDENVPIFEKKICMVMVAIAWKSCPTDKKTKES